MEPIREGLGAADTEARRHADARIAASGDLIASLGHDYNNLFSVIIGSVGILEDVFAHEAGRADDRVLAEDALSAAREASALLERLLECMGRATYVPASTDLSGFLETFWGIVARTVPAEVDLGQSIDADLGRVRLDPDRLEKALFEVVVNAREAMAQGGSLVLEARLVRLDGRTAAALDVHPGRYALVEVLDSGSGMAPETLRTLYRPFFTTKRPRKGRGFGLASAFGFARQAGGVLVTASGAGGGTQVSLLLPRFGETA